MTTPRQTRFAIWFCISLCLGPATAAPTAKQENLIPATTFRDDDDDGKIDGWEAKTFFLEKDRKNPGNPQLSLKIKQEKDYQIIGEVSTVFQGKAPGYHQVTIRYMDENDGISTARLLVNDKVVHIWDFDNIFVNHMRDEVVDNVYLEPGDKITIWAANDFTEYCRLISVRVVPSPQPPTKAEIEALQPPAVADRTFGPLVPLRDFRDLSSENTRPESQVKGSGDLLFAARANERIAIQMAPTSARSATLEASSVGFLGATATGLEKAAAASELAFPFDPETRSGAALFTAPAAGLYRLTFRNAAPALEIPHVYSCAEQGRGNPSSPDGLYFFVPKGTKSFALKALANAGRTTEVLLLTPAGKLCKRTCLDAKEELAVRVPDGQDDGVWMVGLRGVSPRLVLRGVPPFVASHPRHMLVPRECVVGGSSKGKADR
jgi:hypothetical protein